MGTPPPGLLELRCPVRIAVKGHRRTCDRLLAYVAPDARLQVYCRGCGSTVERLAGGRLSVKRGPERPTRADDTAPGSVAGATPPDPAAAVGRP